MPAKRGEDSPTAKLTEKEVYAIRRDTRQDKLVAYDYGISQMHVWRIRHRIKWKHLKEENENDTRSSD
jgi:hypothetical protein